MTYAERAKAVERLRTRPTERQIGYLKALIHPRRGAFTEHERKRIERWIETGSPTKSQMSRAVQKAMARVNAREEGRRKFLKNETTMERQERMVKAEKLFLVDTNIALDPGEHQMKLLQVLERYDTAYHGVGTIKRFRVFACWNGAKDTIFIAYQIKNALTHRFCPHTQVMFPYIASTENVKINKEDFSETFQFPTEYPDGETGAVHIEIITRPLSDAQMKDALNPKCDVY